MTTPKRIQFSRRHGQRMPEGAVYVGRHMSKMYGKWGNPFTVAVAIEAGYQHPRRVCAANYRAWLTDVDNDQWHIYYQDVYVLGSQTFDRRVILADLPQLAGRDLACWCPLPDPGEPDWCHGAVLLELANPVMEVAFR